MGQTHIYIKAIEIARLNKIEDAFCFAKSDNLICAKKSSNVPKGDMNKYIFKNLHPNPPLDRDIMIAIFPDVILSYYLKILCNRLRFYMCLQHLWSQYSTLKNDPFPGQTSTLMNILCYIPPPPKKF